MVKVPKTTNLQNLNDMLDHLDSWYVYTPPSHGNSRMSIKDFYK